MITVSDVSLHFSEKPLFKDVKDGIKKWSRDNPVVADETVMFLYSVCRGLHTENKMLQDKEKENAKNILGEFDERFLLQIRGLCGILVTL